MAAPENEKTREQLVQEIKELRQRLAESEAVPVIEKRKEENRASRKCISDAQGSPSKAVFTIDIEGRITRVCPDILLLIGYSHEELIGARHTLIFNQEIIPGNIDKPAGEFSNGKIFDHHRMEVISKGGGSIPVRVSAAPIYEEGKLAGVVGIVEDICRQTSDTKDIERVYGQYREQQMFFRSLFELGNIGLAITSPEKGWLKINAEICKMLGYPESELMQKTWSEMTHPDDLETDVKQFNAMLAGEIDSYEMDKRFIRKDGGIVYTHLTVACQRKPNGDVDFVMASLLDITERKQIEEAFRNNDVKLQSAQRIAHLGIWQLDLATNHVDWSNELYSILGLNPDNPPPDYTEHGKLFAHESWKKLSTSLANTQETGTPYELELEFVRPDGKHGWMLARGEALRSENGVIVGLQGVALDITERKESEATLAESEARYRMLFECTMDYILVLEPQPDGPPVIIDANEAAFEKHGYSREEMTGQPISLLDTEQAEETIEERMRILAAGKPYRFETRHKCKDGSVFSVEITGQMISMGDRKILYTIERDITERKQAEEALRENEERIKAIADYTYDWESWLGPDGHLMWVNPAVEKLTGYSMHECLEMADFPLPIVHKNDRLEFGKLMMQGIKDRVSLNDFSFRIVHKDGSVHWMAVSWQPIYNKQGEYAGLRTSVRDIDERKRVESELLKARSDLQNFFNFVPDMVCVVSAEDGCFTQVNNAWEAVLGYRTDELIDKPFVDFIHPDDVALTIAEVERQLRGGETHDFVNRYRSKDGSYRWLEWVASPAKPNQLLYAAARDISDRKQAESKLTLFRRLIDQSNDAIFLIDPVTSDFIDVNGTACSSLGYSRDELLSMGVMDIEAVLPDKDAWDAMIEIMREARGKILEGTHIRKDGSRFPVEVSLKYVSQEDVDYLVAAVRDVSERKQAEAKLSESEERYRRLFDNEHTVMLVIDPQDGAIIQANPAAATYYGWPVEKLMHMNISDINVLPPDQIHEKMERVRTDKKNRFVFKHRRAHGEPRDVEVYSGPIHIHGRLLLYSIVLDITSRLQVEKALRKSEERYRAVVGDQTEVISRFLPDGTFTFVSDTFCKFFQTNREEILGGTWKMVAVDDDAAMVKAKLARLTPAQPVVSIENRVQLPDGSKYWMEFINRGFFDEQGVVTEIQSVGRDITDRKQAEDNLKKSEKIFRDMVESIPLAIYVSTGINQICEYVNPKFIDLFGYTMAEVPTVGDWWPLAYPDESYRQQVAEEWQSKVEKAIRERSIIEPMDVVVTCKDGSKKNITWGYITLEDKNYAFGLDLTDRKQAERTLLDSESRLRESILRSPYPIMMHAEDGEVLMLSNVWSRITGYELSDIPTTKTWAGKAYATRAEEVADYIASLYDLKDVRQEGKYEVRTANGEVRLWDFQSQPLQALPDGRRVVLSLAIDITDRQKAEDTLRISESNLKEAQKIARMGRWELDIVENKLHWSDTIYEIFGIDKDKFGATYDAFLDAIHPDDVEAVNRAYTDSLKNKKPYRIEHRLLLKDGSIKWVSELCHTDYDSDGRALRSVGVVHDITERKLAECQLAEKMKQIERFNEFAVGRELEMLHLKDEVNSLLEKLGRQKKYKAPDRVREESNPVISPATSQGEGNESTE